MILFNLYCDRRYVSIWGKIGVERGGFLKGIYGFLVVSLDLIILEGIFFVFFWSFILIFDFIYCVRLGYRMIVFEIIYFLNLERKCFKELGRGKREES